MSFFGRHIFLFPVYDYDNITDQHKKAHLDLIIKTNSTNKTEQKQNPATNDSLVIMHGNRQYKPKKLKRLNDINDNDNSCNKKSVSIRDTYEFDHDHFCNTFMRSHYRPLQAVSTMLSHAPQQQVDGEGESYGFDLPLIKQFFNSISSKTKKNRNVIVDTATSDTNSLSQSKNNHKGSIESKCPLEQVSTTLSLGHHMRFKELLLEIEKDYGLHPNDNQRRKRAFHNKRSRQREFRKLCDLFREERCLYAKALNEFQVNNAKRFLTGFRSKPLFR